MSYPKGGYTDVYVYPIQHQSGSLRPPSRGNYFRQQNEGNFIFNCRDFDNDDQPKINTFYNISAVHNGQRYEFNGVKCLLSGNISAFLVK